MDKDLTLYQTIEAFFVDQTFEKEKDLEENDIESSQLRRLFSVLMCPDTSLFSKDHASDADDKNNEIGLYSSLHLIPYTEDTEI